MIMVRRVRLVFMAMRQRRQARFRGMTVSVMKHLVNSHPHRGQPREGHPEDEQRCEVATARPRHRAHYGGAVCVWSKTLVLGAHLGVHDPRNPPTASYSWQKKKGELNRRSIRRPFCGVA